jgi:naphthalene 1,2-dioxygenase system ferredoxin subunit
MTDTWTKVAKLSDLEEEYPTRLKLGEREVALCLVEGEVFAIDNVCSHAFAFLSDGHLEGHELFCPLHQGSFDVRTGAAVTEPCTVNLATYPIKVEGDDVYLKVELVAE